jgi:putative phosphoesterase
LRVGLISDTHGLLRPEALRLLEGSDAIVHAGDIGDEKILETLRGIAPVTAVRGNNDTSPWARSIAETEVLQAGEALIYVIHDLALLDIDPGAAGMHAVISGHSHKPRSEVKDGVLFVNPGSAGPRRFKLPISVGSLRIEGTRITAELREISA